MLLDAEQAGLDQSSVMAAASRPKDIVPEFRALAVSALAPVGLVMALELMHGKAATAEALFGGYAMALLVYGMLMLFAKHMFSLFVPGAPSAQGNTQALGFALMSSGKFIVLGIVLFVLIRLLHLNLIWLIGGFLLTQITISIIILSRLAKTKITG